MYAYHFHCTDGVHVVIGREIHGSAELRATETQVAREILALYPGADASRWHVTVQDGSGRQVAVSRFDELLDAACPERPVPLTFSHGATETRVHRARSQGPAAGAR
jgi:hypothetical protein